MKISVFGLGYVGAVSAACLRKKVTKSSASMSARRRSILLMQGSSPIVEEGIGELINQMVGEKMTSRDVDC
jgi:GDP-mannose 6-dehydrogenase